MKDIFELESLISGKNIALVGNSNKVLGKQYPVDKHDIVIRMNRAWDLSDEMKNDVGHSLDILAVSIEKDNITMLAERYESILWMTPKHRNEISIEVAQKLYFYPLEWWDILHERLGANPSTGCMMMDVIQRLIGDGSVTLYGFDFFKSGNWYQSKSLKNRVLEVLGFKVKHNPHSATEEENFIRTALPDSQFRIEEL